MEYIEWAVTDSYQTQSKLQQQTCMSSNYFQIYFWKQDFQKLNSDLYTEKVE